VPIASSQQAKHTKRRVARYLASLMKDGSDSLTSIGKLVGVSASRVADWSSGKRVISPEKAFELGSALRLELGWRTSGIEFLWATGYWSEVLGVLKYLALDSELGTDATVMLYSWLPQRMILYEIEEVEARLRDRFAIDVDATSEDVRSFLETIVASDPGSGEADRYFTERSLYQSDVNRQRLCADLDADCGSHEFHGRILSAWERYNNADLEGTPSLEVTVKFANPFAVFELHIIDAVIDASRRLNEHIFPSYVIPKIWRLSAGWLYEIADSGPSVWFPAIPTNFLTAADRDLRAFVAFD
jgi:transcriptional regulator with XRE-family HTH domain